MKKELAAEVPKLDLQPVNSDARAPLALSLIGLDRLSLVQ
jgi:hypothetical protein